MVEQIVDESGIQIMCWIIDVYWFMYVCHCKDIWATFTIGCMQCVWHSRVFQTDLLTPFELV